jgi:hypothetical protein
MWHLLMFSAIRIIFTVLRFCLVRRASPSLGNIDPGVYQLLQSVIFPGGSFLTPGLVGFPSKPFSGLFDNPIKIPNGRKAVSPDKCVYIEEHVNMHPCTYLVAEGTFC